MFRKTLPALIVLLLFMSAAAEAGPKSQTWTRYPIVLVPGVFDFHNVFGMGIDYFYGIETAIEDSSYSPNLFTHRPFHQKTHVIVLNPWQNTTDRAMDLKAKLTALMTKNRYAKVNLIAHSHGATTARQAVAMMAKEANEASAVNPIASLTTIAGPHRGTPVADFYTDNPTGFFNQLMTLGLDLSGNFMALISTGMMAYLGDQRSADVFQDFSRESIAAFNEAFPSAGLPESQGPYGEGAAPHGAPAGDGLGQAMNPDDPEAIVYYSWTGNIGTEWGTAWDPADLAMMVTREMNASQGFENDADGFIPVTSARFGTVICESFYWNHIDEINQTLGLIHPDAEDPRTIFRLHAQRLQQAGR